MAIKDQCIKCHHFQDVANKCNVTNSEPYYNCSSCDKYEANSGQRIDLSKNNSTSSVQVQTQPSVPQPQSGTQNNCSAKKGFIKHLFSFDGRIRRLEYCLTYLVYTFVYVMPMEIIPEEDLSAGYSLIWLLLLIPAIWIMYAQGAKRCHDRGNSGWYQLVPFYVLWMWFAPGDAGDNEYGPSPKS